MKHITYTCDRCGKTITDERVYAFKMKIILGEDDETTITSVQSDAMTYCQDCADIVASAICDCKVPESKHVNIKPKKAEKTAEPKKRGRPSKVQKIFEEKAKKKDIDYGRIRALNHAGWSSTRIADDVNCTIEDICDAIEGPIE